MRIRLERVIVVVEKRELRVSRVDYSVVGAPYEIKGEIVGVLGVIGPTRIAYEQVIPIVDVTARLLTSALNTQK